MRIFVVPVVMALGVCGVITVPPRASQTKRPDYGEISGQVLAPDGKSPLRHAVVRINCAERQVRRSVTTNAEGRWSFKALPPCRYSIVASKDRYLALEYAQRRPGAHGRVIDLKALQHIKNADFILPKGAVVAGAISDEFGEPFPGLRVSALQLQYRDGQRRLASVGPTAITDDLGQFRIYGLAPGDYVISATPEVSPFSDSDDVRSYRASYYPGSPLASNATKVSVSTGEELTGISFNIVPVPDATVSGLAVGSNGAPMRDAVVMLKTEGSSVGGLTLLRPVPIAEDGSFRITHVPPGSYRLETRSVADLERLANVGSTALAFTDEFGSVPVSIDGTDVSGVVVTARPSGVIRGEITLARQTSGGQPTWSDLPLELLNPDGDGLSPGSTTVIHRDGTFEARVPAGHWLFRLRAPQWILKGVAVDGVDAIDTGIEIGSSKLRTGVVVTIDRPTKSIEGSVTDASGSPVTDYVAVAFPTDESKWSVFSRFVKAASPDQNGDFSLSGLPEGEYYLVAVDYLERGEETDPDLLRRLRKIAARVTVSDTSQTVALKLTTTF